MKHLSFATVITLFLTFSLANDFEDELKNAEANSTLCREPALAEDKLTKNFRYGCFCGKDYPNLQHPSQKDYTELNLSQRKELIIQYFKVKPYDTIDEACLKHDTCYIYNGNPAQSCNDTLYSDLTLLKEIFRKKERQEGKEYKKWRRCRAMTADMASVFNTILGIGDDVSIMDFSMMIINTPITVATKTIDQSTDILSSESDYPLEGEQCIATTEDLVE